MRNPTAKTAKRVSSYYKGDYTMDSSSLYKDSRTNTLASLLILSLGIIGVCLYLTNYYFQTKYPVGLAAASLCDVNSFFNCDATTNSPLSNVFGVPISLFGLCIGIFSLAGFLFNSGKYERTLYTVLLANVIGCVVLFIYSLSVLNTLCPFCTLYYILSFLLFLVFHKKLVSKQICPKIFAFISLFFAVVFVPAYTYVQSKEVKNEKMKGPLMEQYRKLPNLGFPEKESPYKISYPTNGQAPLKIVKFSDFQCPSCKALSEILGKAAQRYKGKIDIQYVFYPLSSLCNPEVKTAFHEYSCYASYLSYCLPQKFRTIEHLIFANQENLSFEWIESVAKREGVLDCFKADETKNAVIEMVKSAAPFNVQSTPTMLVNGKKISGALPSNQLFIIFDEILSGQE